MDGTAQIRFWPKFHFMGAEVVLGHDSQGTQEYYLI